MKIILILSAILAVGVTQIMEEGPKPYSFNYVAEGDEGRSSHAETADGSGTVRGTYSLADADGRNRVVEYVAGPAGFTAIVRTNEPGTNNASPADVVVESAAEATLKFGAAAGGVAAAAAPRPEAPSANRGGNTRFVLVPADDPRAVAYSGTS